jgi:hypothetical protein
LDYRSILQSFSYPSDFAPRPGILTQDTQRHPAPLPVPAFAAARLPIRTCPPYSAAAEILISPANHPDPAYRLVRPHRHSMARTYADVNANMPRSYWDYDSVNISWGALENYEVVRKIGALFAAHRRR